MHFENIFVEVCHVTPDMKKNPTDIAGLEYYMNYIFTLFFLFQEMFDNCVGV